MSRLAHVLRAGEARRQSRSQSGVVRTGTLAMEDMGDDVLRSILDALARGASNEACTAAKNWCTLNTQHRRACARRPKHESSGRTCPPVERSRRPPPK